MENIGFFIVDVFAEKKYSGNQLAVISDANNLSDIEMQKIANEMHFSETTFIFGLKLSNGGYDARIFTPAREVPFAGHPTLGTAYVINHFLAPKQAREIILNLKAGQIRVVFEKNQSGEEILWMKQLPPVFGRTFDPARICDLLGLDKSDFDSRYPIQEVSTGLPFVIVPLKSLSAVKLAKVNLNANVQLMQEIQAGILVFSPETYNKENNLNARVFVDVFGIPEDPATGSGNGCLAAYLTKNLYFGDSKVDVKVEQGYEINRPSLLYLKAKMKDGEIEVSVGGQVIFIGKGELV